MLMYLEQNKKVYVAVPDDRRVDESGEERLCSCWYKSGHSRSKFTGKVHSTCEDDAVCGEKISWSEHSVLGTSQLCLQVCLVIGCMSVDVILS